MMSSLREFKAFQGDDARKQAMIAPLVEAWGAGKVPPCNVTKWQVKLQPGSISALCAGSESAADYERHVGLPALLGALIDLILMANVTGSLDEKGEGRISMPEYAARLPADILQAIPVGADAAKVPILYLAAVLDDLGLAGPPLSAGLSEEVRTAVRGLASLHRASVSGQSVEAQAWSQARYALAALSDAATDPLAKDVLQFAETVAWPSGLVETELVPAFQGMSIKLGEHAMMTALTSEQRATALRVAEGRRALMEQLASSREAPAELMKRWKESPEGDIVHSNAWKEMLVAARLTTRQLVGGRLAERLIGVLRTLPMAGRP